MTVLLSIQDVMDRLQMSRPTVDRLVPTGAIRASRVGRQWRIRPEDLESYLDSCVPTEPIADRWKLNLAHPSEGE